MDLVRAAVAAFFLVAACAPDPSGSGDVRDTRQTEPDGADAAGDDVVLTLVETLAVDFGAMSGGVAEGAVLRIEDLTSEPAFVVNRERFRCATIDTSASALRFDDVAASGAAIELTLEVAARASDAFTLLARYVGPAEVGADVPLDDAAWTVSAAGQDALERIVLGDAPAYDVRVTATATTALSALRVTAELALALRSACP